MKNNFNILVMMCTLLYSNISYAENPIEVNIYIKNHHFYPSELKLPPGKKIRINVFNQDSTIEEFESTDLKREKIIPGGSKATIILAPLKEGIYEFVGEFNEDTAKGRIIIENLKEVGNV